MKNSSKVRKTVIVTKKAKNKIVIARKARPNKVKRGMKMITKR